MARNDGIDRTVARNQDLETPDDVAKVQAVSYTHLDVYKRQLAGIVVEPCNATGSFVFVQRFE